MKSTPLFLRRGRDTAENPPSAKARRSMGFSLVEILTVVAIMSVLAYLALPMISSMQQSGNLTASGNEIADLASSAQEYAVSHNTMTALVAVTNASGAPQAQYRSFVVLAYNSSTSTWSQVSKWLRLPDASIMSSASANTFLSFNGSYTQTFPSLTLNGANVGGTGNCAYQIFKPDGSMDSSATSIVLQLVATQQQGATNPKNWYDLIFNPMTGTIQVNRP